jgi:mannitol/fructose-specific phosphotransferase system IIA component (Ntr-type)
MGLLIMSALTINDVAGWIVFAMILGFFSGAMVSVWSLGFILAATVVFSAIFLSIGPALLDRAILYIKRHNVPEPAGSLTLVCLCGLAGGAITTWIGIHALFGFFIAGIMAGESKQLSEHTRHIFSQMVQAILVPIFFASIGLKLDFVGQFDLMLALFILVIGVFGRYYGAYVGARLIRQPATHGKFIGWAHVPGGEMQIVIGMVALEYGVITQPVYVAIVFGAILSSVIAGPLMKKVLQGVKRVDWLAYLPLDHVLADLTADSRDEAVECLCGRAGSVCASHAAEAIVRAVREREREMTTALGDGIAVPHARMTGLDQPLLLFTRSKHGIEWNATDGQPVKLIFLLLTPAGDESAQLQILQGIAHVLNAPRLRAQLLRAPEASDILQVLRTATAVS